MNANNKRTIGIIGAGAIGKAFARQVTKAGYEVMISNSRGPETLKEFVKSLDGNIKEGSVQDSANADIIFLALPWQRIEQVASAINSWKGKIVIDPANPILPGFVLANLDGKTSSEVVEGWIKGAHLVKAFNTLTPQLLSANPKQAGGNRVIFYSGNESSSKEIVGGIIDKIGFAGIDLGSLNEGGKLQQFPGGPLPTLNLLKLD
ncbi:MAG: NAD(P)-binding domain-containing protein [Bacteroidota bacterium]